MQPLRLIPTRLLAPHLLAWLAALAPGLLLAQPVPIGRSTLSLPNPAQWQVDSLSDLKLGYTGDKSGDFVLQAKRLIFRSATSSVKAVMVLGVTKGGVGGIQMSWQNNCANASATNFLYVRDAGNPNAVDCLIVGAIAQTGRFVDRLPDLKRHLDGNLPEGGPTYYIEFQKSLGAGGYAVSQLLLSQDFKGLQGASVKHSTQIPEPVLAWAEEFAKNNRGAIASFSGAWAVPALTFEKE